MNFQIRKIGLLFLLASKLVAMDKKIILANPIDDNRTKEIKTVLEPSMHIPALIKLICAYCGPLIPVKLRIHHHVASNALLESWHTVTAPDDTEFIVFKQFIASLINRPTKEFRLEKIELTGAIAYDQNSEKTIAELGISNSTTIWAIPISPKTKK